jgi:hypothetical protein
MERLSKFRRMRVEKAAARILVYNTTPRFALWALPRENRLELIRELRPKLLLHEWAPGGTARCRTGRTPT